MRIGAPQDRPKSASCTSQLPRSVAESRPEGFGTFWPASASGSRGRYFKLHFGLSRRSRFEISGVSC
eukprot:scaffold2224_cov261-Pinguiococcus_pyrenoidosus.AAC.4